jgi:EmrB/QacA subfamily drug resistance transporter
MSAPTTTAAEAEVERTKAFERRWWTLAVLCLSLLIVFVGNSSLNVAIPTLARDFNASNSELQWVVAAYSLVFAGLLFSTGAIGDRFGRKGALQFGLFGFLVSAALASQATAMWQLIACRALMGGSAAFIMPSTLSIIVNIFPPHERAKAIAIWASVTGAAGVVGPVASGWLLGHFWFGSIFLINVPTIIVALVGGFFLVPKSKDPEQGKLDPGGAVLSIVGISAVVYALIEAPAEGWLSAVTLCSLAIGVAVLTAFVFYELRRGEPMLDIRFFKNKSFSTGTGGMMLVFLAMYGVMFLITQYFQLVLGYSALSAALRLLPMAPIMIIVTPFTPKLSAKFGSNRVVTAGMAFLTFGLLVFASLTLHTSYGILLLGLFPLVTGISLTMSPMTGAIMSAVPARRAGAGSAMNDATRELGAALGIAVLGSIAASKYNSALSPFISNLTGAQKAKADQSLTGALSVAGQLTGAAKHALTIGAQQSFIDGVHTALIVGAILTAVSAVIVYRRLPQYLAPEGAMHGGLESLEDAAELFYGGAPTAFGDEYERDDSGDTNGNGNGNGVSDPNGVSNGVSAEATNQASPAGAGPESGPALATGSATPQ